MKALYASPLINTKGVVYSLANLKNDLLKKIWKFLDNGDRLAGSQ